MASITRNSERIGYLKYKYLSCAVGTPSLFGRIVLRRQPGYIARLSQFRIEFTAG